MNQAILHSFAKRYIWWQPPEESAKNPDRVLAQVMDIGTLEDCKTMMAEAGSARLQQVLLQARPGQLRPKSWNFWHAVLGLATTPAAIPMPPARSIP